MSLKRIKPGRRYLICNIDERYAEKVYNAIKAGAMAEGKWTDGDIDFETFVKQTWGDTNLRDSKEDTYRKCLNECKLAFQQLYKNGINPDNEIIASIYEYVEDVLDLK